MASASVFTVVTMQKQFNDDTLLKKYTDKYRELRLESLKSDPDAFSSTFEDESRQPSEFWTGRMLVPRARHFVAVQWNTTPDIAPTSDDLYAVLEAKWVGTLVLLGPKVVASGDASPWRALVGSRFVEDSAEATSDTGASAYHLAGFYVAPEVRGRGLGGSLVNTAIEKIADDGQTIHSAGAICTVGASQRNLVVRRLFKRMGFLEVAEEVCKTKDGRSLTEVILRRDFWR
jgi:GNAT superfamily N-acetyltransferase